MAILLRLKSWPIKASLGSRMIQNLQNLGSRTHTIQYCHKFHTSASLQTKTAMYDGRIFGSMSNSDNGEVGSETRFHYHQREKIVWAEYSGGSIVKGSLIAKVLDDSGELDMRYHHINRDGELMTGQCRSIPEKLADGRIRLHEKWQWTSGDKSSGESIIEEVQK